MKSQYPYRVSRQAASAQTVRRRRAAALAGGVLVALLASIVGLDSFSNGGRGLAAVAAAAKDPAALFAKRSPGARGGGSLLQTKPGHKPPAPAFSERGGMKPPPPPVADTPVTYQPDQLGAVPGEDAPVPFAMPAIASSIEGFTPPVTLDGTPSVYSLSTPPGGGGGGGGGGGDGCCTNTLRETPGVPEPSVWAMLIVGFFSVGAMMRANRRAETAAKAEPVRVTHS